MTLTLCTHSTWLDDSDRAAGVSAAAFVFALAGEDPEKCQSAYIRLTTGKPCDASDLALAKVWDDAETAAIEAATEGWMQIPNDLSLSIA